MRLAEEGRQVRPMREMTVGAGPERTTTPFETPRSPSVLGHRGRIQRLVEIAAANGSSISLTELFNLLPPQLFPSPEDLGRFIVADEELSADLAAAGDEVTVRGQEALAARRSFQRSLTQHRLERADRFLGRLVRMCPWADLAAVSGSTAYGGAKPTDDIDFFLVTQEHRLWTTLLWALALARIERLRDPEAPVYCFNRITERTACERTFRERRDSLFAREALNLRVLRGQGVYHRLLDSARWMAGPFPTLYASRLAAAPATSDRTETTDGFLGRLMNGGAFLVLGPYLSLAGLVRNVRLRRAGRREECFRTIVRRDFWATESVLYDELREEYREVFDG